MENLLFVGVALCIGGVAGYLYCKRKHGLSKKGD